MSMAPFSVAVEPKGDKSAEITVTGAMDAHTFEPFLRAATQLIDAGTLWIVLDLRSMGYITSVGINFLVNFRLLRKKAGGDVVIVKPPPSVLNVLEMIGLLAALVVVDSVEEAWKAIARAKAPGPDKAS
jgi:anti-anti-sigma factor